MPPSRGRAPVPARPRVSQVEPEAFPAVQHRDPERRRIRMVTHGTRAWKTAQPSPAPLRIVPARSTPVPITNPGWSRKLHRGDVEGVAEVDEALHLLAAVGCQPPAVVVGVVRRDATGYPFRRANPVTSGRPKRRPISKKEPRSRTSSSTWRTL